MNLKNKIFMSKMREIRSRPKALSANNDALHFNLNSKIQFGAKKYSQQLYSDKARLW